MTASTLIRMFQDRAASTSTVISVGCQTATIVSVCSPYCIPESQPSPMSTPEQEEGRLTSNTATLLNIPAWEDLLPVWLSSLLQQSLFGKVA